MALKLNLSMLLRLLLLVRRLRQVEPSSWAGLALIASGLGQLGGLSPEEAGALGAAIGGLAVLVPERKAPSSTGTDSEAGSP